MSEGRSNFEEMMNQAIEEELKKGESLKDIGNQPIEIKPLTLEERLRSKRMREKAASQAEQRAKDEEAELPEIEVIEVLTDEPAAPEASKETAQEAKEVVEQRRQTALDNRIKGLMQQLEEFDRLQGPGARSEVTEKIRVQLESDKKDLLMDLWSDAVRNSPEAQVFATQIGVKNAKPGDMDTFNIGIRELAKNFQATAGKMNIASTLLDRLKSDRKYVRGGIPRTAEQWDEKIKDTRGRIQKDFKTFVDAQIKLRQRLSRLKGGAGAKDGLDQSAAA